MRSDSDPRTIKELGFGRWCSEVLFYHYKWHIIGTVSVIAVVLLLLFMNAGVPDNDISVIVAVSEPLDSKSSAMPTATARSSSTSCTTTSTRPPAMTKRPSRTRKR